MVCGRWGSGALVHSTRRTTSLFCNVTKCLYKSLIKFKENSRSSRVLTSKKLYRISVANYKRMAYLEFQNFELWLYYIPPTTNDPLKLLRGCSTNCWNSSTIQHNRSINEWCNLNLKNRRWRCSRFTGTSIATPYKAWRVSEQTMKFQHNPVQT